MYSITEILELTDEYESELPAVPSLPPAPAGAQIAGWIDHTLQKPEATSDQIAGLCKEARKYNFASVCVNPAYVPLASGLLADSQVLVCTVAGFPLGATLPTQKSFEALSCILFGASEIDMVMNIGALKSEAYGLVLNDVQSVAQTLHNQKAILKVILETSLLTRREKIIACLICKAAGADFVMTSTGYVPSGATIEDVDLMYRVVSPNMEVKATGGIRDYETATAMIRAGATRLGASASVNIIREALE
ncbi:deoxyribose-phosphate aldolase [Chloroflexota bacterium]